MSGTNGQHLQSTGFHPVAEIFPLMQGDDFRELVSDIHANGLHHKIVLHPDDHKIIDGRNRYRACVGANVTPEYELWDGKGDLIQYVLSLNLHRRHLSESQRAMVAAKIANIEVGDNQYRQEGLPKGKPSVSQPQAAEMLNVSAHSVVRAKKVKDHGAPELVDAVERGEVSVSAAEIIARHDHDTQREIVKAGPKAVVKEAQRITAGGANTPAAGKTQARVHRIAALIRELVELTSRPHHRFPFIQVKQKTGELSEAFSKAFGLE